ncbi:hypothetical protein JHK85_037415 [Glycine max]|nr:hypothetical protein JHK85_037415 [Glycine max]
MALLAKTNASHHSIMRPSLPNPPHPDEQGTKNTKSLTVNDVWSLSPIEGLLWNGMMMTQRLKIGALLNRFLGHFARDYDVFLIGYTNWKKILKDYKQDVHNNIIQNLCCIVTVINVIDFRKVLDHANTSISD